MLRNRQARLEWTSPDATPGKHEPPQHAVADGCAGEAGTTAVAKKQRTLKASRSSSLEPMQPLH
jgi:hypothetical protein